LDFTSSAITVDQRDNEEAGQLDDLRAEALLAEERRRVEGLLASTRQDATSEQESAGESGDIADSAEPITGEELDDATVESLQARLDAIARAEQRLQDGTYGRSLRSGAPIPDARLEADPAAELTVEEAADQA
jgi:DnaK suppressor protein